MEGKWKYTRDTVGWDEKLVNHALPIHDTVGMHGVEGGSIRGIQSGGMSNL